MRKEKWQGNRLRGWLERMQHTYSRLCGSQIGRAGAFASARLTLPTLPPAIELPTLATQTGRFASAGKRVRSSLYATEKPIQSADVLAKRGKAAKTERKGARDGVRGLSDARRTVPHGESAVRRFAISRTLRQILPLHMRRNLANSGRIFGLRGLAGTASNAANGGGTLGLRGLAGTASSAANGSGTLGLRGLAGMASNTANSGGTLGLRGLAGMASSAANGGGTLGLRGLAGMASNAANGGETLGLRGLSGVRRTLPHGASAVRQLAPPQMKRQILPLRMRTRDTHTTNGFRGLAGASPAPVAFAATLISAGAQRVTMPRISNMQSAGLPQQIPSPPVFAQAGDRTPAQVQVNVTNNCKIETPVDYQTVWNKLEDALRESLSVVAAGG